jgi:hypothetical protein
MSKIYVKVCRIHCLNFYSCSGMCITKVADHRNIWLLLLHFLHYTLPKSIHIALSWVIRSLITVSEILFLTWNIYFKTFQRICIILRKLHILLQTILNKPLGDPTQFLAPKSCYSFISVHTVLKFFCGILKHGNQYCVVWLWLFHMPIWTTPKFLNNYNIAGNWWISEIIHIMSHVLLTSFFYS